MQKAGLILVVSSVLLIASFVVDQLTMGTRRSQWQNEKLDDRELQEVRPADLDPLLFEPTIADDVTNDRFFLSSEELRLADAKEDYEYSTTEGDTIDILARKYLGSHEFKDMLYRENEHLRRGQKIPVGTKLTIPFRFRRD